MKCLKIAHIIVLLVFASACSGVGQASDTLNMINAEDVIPNRVEFELVQSPDIEEFSTREWELSGDTLYIGADITGDGLIDQTTITFQYVDDEEPSVGLEGEKFVIKWQHEIPDSVNIGDADGDGDADVVLDADAGYYLMNTGSYIQREPYDDAAFSDLLARVGELAGTGKTREAFELSLTIALGTPHDWSPPGEGAGAEFDRDSEVDFNLGNCITWVEQALAMVASGGDRTKFYEELIKIRYADGMKDYAMRNHFQSADWLPNNIAAGHIKDILPEIMDGDAPVVTAEINKRNWYAAKSALEGDFSELTDAERAERLEGLRMLGALMPEENVTLGYFPFKDMIVETRSGPSISSDFIRRLPDVTIFNVVNDGLEMTDADGNWVTDLVVTHVGFIIKDDEGRPTVFHSTNKTDAALSIMAEEDFASFIVHRYLDGGGTAVGLNLSEPVIGSSLRSISALNTIKTILTYAVRTGSDTK